MTDATSATPNLFVPRAEGEGSRTDWLRLLRRLQDLSLLAWVAFVSFLPQNWYGLLALLPLGGLWCFMLLVGVWHIIKAPDRRGEAAWVIAVPPATFFLVTTLHSTVGMPLVGPPVGERVFFGALSILPLYWLTRWLLRTTSPRSESPVRMRLTTVILLAIATMLMLQSVFLVCVIWTGDTFTIFRSLFGNDWYTNLLLGTLGTTAAVAVVAVPYAILGMVRGTGRKGALLAIIACLTVAGLCTLGVLGFIAMFSYG